MDYQPAHGGRAGQGLSVAAPPERDTIAAVATPAGRGGIGIVRVSGPDTPALAETLLDRCPPARRAELATFRDGERLAIDQGLALYFPAPHSFTGEHVLELHGHGGPVVLGRLLDRVLALGARPARPGEFSERAFLNDRLDLSQAEAIADLIDAGSSEAATAAMRSLEGAFSKEVHALVEAVTDLRVYVEAAIDFPDEEVDFLSEGRVQQALGGLLARFDALADEARRGALLRDGMTLVLAGRPNVGKSSLLNRLARRESAIVTEVAGTTRDVLREHLVLDGLALNVIDTAGLRESRDPVEREGVRRARDEMQTADRILLLLDDRQGLTREDRRLLQNLPPGPAVTLVYNKCDLSAARPGDVEGGGADKALRISALTGAGMDALREHIKACVGFTGAAGAFSARQRHLDALARALEAVSKGDQAFAQSGAGELLAEDLRAAQQHLGEITGAVTSEDLLGRIFASFCIGK
jgi:tRNA modification GTPase